MKTFFVLPLTILAVSLFFFPISGSLNHVKGDNIECFGCPDCNVEQINNHCLCTTKEPLESNDEDHKSKLIYSADGCGVYPTTCSNCLLIIPEVGSCLQQLVNWQSHSCQIDGHLLISAMYNAEGDPYPMMTIDVWDGTILAGLSGPIIFNSTTTGWTSLHYGGGKGQIEQSYNVFMSCESCS